jgi:hypothetical protein
MLIMLPGLEVYGGGTTYLPSYVFMLGGTGGKFAGTVEAYGLYGGG